MKKTQILSLTAIALAAAISGCAKKQVQAPPPPPPPPPPPVVDTTPPPPPPPPPPVDTMALRRQRLQGLMTEALKPIYFDYDASEVKPEGRQILTQIGDVLKQYPELSVTIEGHCDERGSSEYNLALGERRANAASSWLKNYGVPATQLKTVSMGEERPAVQGDSEDAFAQNRRDEFIGETR